MYHYVFNSNYDVVVYLSESDYNSLGGDDAYKSKFLSDASASNSGSYVSSSTIRTSACHTWDANTTAWVLDTSLVTAEVSRIDDSLIDLQIKRDTANTLGLTSKVTELDASIAATNQKKTDVLALT